jgi:hypothetical protein
MRALALRRHRSHYLRWFPGSGSALSRGWSKNSTRPRSTDSWRVLRTWLVTKSRCSPRFVPAYSGPAGAVRYCPTQRNWLRKRALWIWRSSPQRPRSSLGRRQYCGSRYRRICWLLARCKAGRPVYFNSSPAAMADGAPERFRRTRAVGERTAMVICSVVRGRCYFATTGRCSFLARLKRRRFLLGSSHGAANGSDLTGANSGHLGDIACRVKGFARYARHFTSRYSVWNQALSA